MQETQVWYQGHEDSLEKETATHSNILAWEILWTEKPGGLQSTGLQKSRHNLVTKQQNHSMRERIIFSTNSNGTTGRVHAAGPQLHTIYKNQFKLIKNLNVKS